MEKLTMTTEEQSRNEALGSVIFGVYIGGAIVLVCLAFLLALIF